ERAPRSGLPPVAGDERRLRVLHVVTNALPEVQAGYTIRTQGIAESQRGAGIDAHVVTRLGFPVDSGAFAAGRDFVHQGIPTHRLIPFRGLPVLAHERIRVGADALTRLAGRLDVNVLHAHSKHENGQVALLTGDRLGLPVVYEARGFLEETWRSRGGDPASDQYLLSREAETACMRAADAVVAVSQAMVDEIVARGIPAAKVNLVGNAVSAEFLEPAPDATRLRARLGIAPDAVAVGMVSTLNDYEGIDVLIDAVAAVDDPRLVLLVVGDGPALAELQRTAHDRLGPDRATFTGRVPHHEAHVHHAALDVFCVPRLRTPVTELVPPLKPLEAMATARPVLVSNLAPLLELVGDGLDPEPRGLAAAAGDADSWSEALGRLLYDSTLRADLGAAGRNWVAEQRTWKAAAATYAGIYRDISRSRVPTREAARE
ncbi:MAG TPA: glycosyltransferase family 4 protein, partial [Intrasporangium sp.]|uniref:glycosyltransferase family 4 protein n=1 Tax=Intrasporangium sp. TaxID=1925024 RepID=UPI002B485DFE